MDAWLTFTVLTLPAVISALQTCSSGTETSSTQILLEMSTALINAGGGMCSCRLTVSRLTRVDMFPGTNWASVCDTYMKIQKWGTSTQCKEDGVVRPLPGHTHDVTTGEEIWFLVVATHSGARGLSGQLQFKVKQPSGQLHIECFEPNTNSSTTTTPSTTTASTTQTISRGNGVTTTPPLPRSTWRITSTAQPMTHTVTVRPPDTTRQGQPTTTSGLTAVSRTTEPSTTQNLRTGCHKCNNECLFKTSIADTVPSVPKTIMISLLRFYEKITTCGNTGGIFAAGVATGIVLVLTAGGLYVVMSRRLWWVSRRQMPDDVPISEEHPTYSGLTSRTEDPINTYDKIDPKSPNGTDNPYINET